MDIDFGRSIDRWCGHDPRYLAFDGAHVGIPINNVNIVGIETPEKHRTVQSQHLRFERFFYRIATITVKSRSRRQEQIYLIDLCNFCLNRGGAKLNTKELVSIINSVDHDDRCSDFICAFIHNLFPAPLCQAISCFMKLLLEDAAVSTVIYQRAAVDFLQLYRIHDLIERWNILISLLTILPQIFYLFM